MNKKIKFRYIYFTTKMKKDRLPLHKQMRYLNKILGHRYIRVNLYQDTQDFFRKYRKYPNDVRTNNR